MPSRSARGAAFRALHHQARPFIVPNAFDAGTARLLTEMGFPALATTSSGLAFGLGRPDGRGAVSRRETLNNVRDICRATALPVSGDLENGFERNPQGVARTIQMAARAGLVGGSIEDATGRPDAPIYEFSHAVERVHAASEAARALAFPFTLTARADNFLHGRLDLDDTLRRLQAFERAGADVLYAPLVPTADLATLIAAVERPVNVLVTTGNADLTVDALAALGIARISLGGALARAAQAAITRAALEMRARGTFTYAADLAPFIS